MTVTQTLESYDKEQEQVNRLQGLYLNAKNEKQKRYENWRRNYRLVNSRGTARAAQSWMPVPRDSEVYPTVSTLVAWMGDQNTNIDIISAADPHSAYSTFMDSIAHDLTLVMKMNWEVLGYRDQIKLTIWDAFQFEAGFFKCAWDQALDGGLGNAVLRRVDPWSLYIDPDATSLDDAEYIVEARRMSWNEIERRWPNTCHKIVDRGGDIGGNSDLEQRPNRTGDSRTFHNLGNLSSTAITRWASPTSASERRFKPRDGYIVYEFWLRENKAYSKEKDGGPDYAERRVEDFWRVVVVAGGCVLMDEKATELWSHGQHPYERYVFDDIGELYGISLIDHLASPQIYINRLLTALQHHAELVGNPVFMEPTNAGTERVGIINKPGQRLRVTAAAMNSGEGPRWLQAPPMGYDVQKLIEFWIGRMDNTSGMSAAVRGATASPRTPEGVIQTVQEAAFVRVRSGLANLEGTLRRCAYKLCDLIIDNYTEPRYVAIVGPQGERTALALNKQHFKVPTAKGRTPLQYSLAIDVGASAPTSRQARMAEADRGFAMGALDRQAWLEAHNYPNWQEINQRISQMEAVGAFQPPGARQRAQRTT